MKPSQSQDTSWLKGKARQMRIEVLKMLYQAGSGHTGGSLSAADIVTALYFAKMRHNPKDPDWPERDRFILSKGMQHQCFMQPWHLQDTLIYHCLAP
jgi:transketolase